MVERRLLCSWEEEGTQLVGTTPLLVCTRVEPQKVFVGGSSDLIKKEKKRKLTKNKPKTTIYSLSVRVRERVCSR